MRKKIIGTLLMLVIATIVQAKDKKDERFAHWENLALGGRFMDRLMPLPDRGERTSDTWGVDAVKPRDITLGIEDPAWSYWGGNIVVADDGKFHKFVCRWREDHPKGHKAWGQSEVVHAVSDSRFGPFKVKEVLGQGHNPEAYRLPDGRYVCYVIGAYYLGKTVDGPWERRQFTFDNRDRKVIFGYSNITFARRTDNTYLMICRGGGVWISRDGLDQPWYQVTQGSNYPKVKGNFEDPVVWRTAIQYHMIVNDWSGRIAYHLRSKDGAHWKADSGVAYLPGVAVYSDGQVEDWYKFERIKILQDEHGRGIQANFAVIDFGKRQDRPNDIHSSKNIPIPLVTGRLLDLMNKEIPTKDTKEIRVRIIAEKGFNPHTDIDLKTLRYGAPEVVDFGKGSTLLTTEKSGDDLIAVFAAEGHAFADHNFAGKLLGRTSKGALLFGYSRLPWVTYNEAILSVLNPVLKTVDGKLAVAVSVTNYGVSASKPSKVVVTIATKDGKVIGEVEGTCSALKPWEEVTMALDAPASMQKETLYDYTVTCGNETQHPLAFKTEPENNNKKKKKKKK